MALSLIALPDWTAGGNESNSPTKGFLPCGPFKVGANLYILSCMPIDSAGALGQCMAIFKSTDNGATWTQKDSAHAPGSAHRNAARSAACVAGTKIVIANWQASNVTGTMHLNGVVFDTATDTYTRNDAGPDSGLPPQSGGNDFDSFSDLNQTLACVTRADGKVSIAFCAQPNSTPAIQYTVYDPTAGTFSGTVTLKNDAGGNLNYVPYGIHIDSTGRKYIPFLLYTLSSGIITLRCLTLSNADALLSDTLITNDCWQAPTPFGVAGENAIGGSYADTTRIVVSRINGAGNLGLSVATLGNAPVWSDFNSTINMLDDGSQSAAGKIAENSGPYFEGFEFWTVQNISPYDPASGSQIGIIYLSYNTTSIKWDLYQTVFDGIGTFSVPTLQVLASSTFGGSNLISVMAGNVGGTGMLVMNAFFTNLTYEPQVFATFPLLPPAPPTGPRFAYMNADGLPVIVLPNPRINCAFQFDQQRKRGFSCVYLNRSK